MIYPEFYANYIKLANSQDANVCLDETFDDVFNFLRSIPESKADYAYDTGKWTIKQLIAHLIDTERIFQYRALRFAREQKNCDGFDHDHYADINIPTHLELEDVIDELYAVRLSTLSLFNSFTQEHFAQVGSVDDNSMDVNACGVIICGHTLHHINILKSKYLNA